MKPSPTNYGHSFPERKLMLIRWHSSIVLMLTAILSFLPVLAYAGGKAEPGLIAFQRGHSSSSLLDSIKGDEEAEYTFRAKRAQRLTVAVDASPGQSIAIELKSPSGVLVTLESSRASMWTSTLPEDGDYFLVCKKVRPTKAISHYTLTVAIK